MTYPQAPLWTKVEPEIEQRTEPEPQLVCANPGRWPPLNLPAIWSSQQCQQWALALAEMERG